MVALAPIWSLQWRADVRLDHFWEWVDLAAWDLDSDERAVGASNADIDFQPADAVNPGLNGGGHSSV
jgi:hypothetical protein